MTKLLFRCAWPPSARVSLAILLVLMGMACNLPTIAPTATATSEATVPAATDTPLPLPTATRVPLGTPANPLILALPPETTAEQLPLGQSLAAGLSNLTGYTIVLVRPDSYTNLVADFGKGNAHMAWLPPFAYLDAYRKGYVFAGMASQRFGTYYYGAQFIANIRGGFTPYYDEISGQNTADAKTALAQFEGYKPCWDDPRSAAGYVIPLGFLKENGVNTKPAAFVEGHSTVVRSVYAPGICDFGATIIDARQSPAVLQEFPDVERRVQVIWRIEPLIPYDVVAFSASIPFEMRIALTNGLILLMASEEGNTTIKSLYLVEGLKPVDDAFYEAFRYYVELSGLDIESLVR